MESVLECYFPRDGLSPFDSPAARAPKQLKNISCTQSEPLRSFRQQRKPALSTTRNLNFDPPKRSHRSVSRPRQELPSQIRSARLRPALERQLLQKFAEAQDPRDLAYRSPRDRHQAILRDMERYLSPEKTRYLSPEKTFSKGSSAPRSARSPPPSEARFHIALPSAGGKASVRQLLGVHSKSLKRIRAARREIGRHLDSLERMDASLAANRSERLGRSSPRPIPVATNVFGVQKTFATPREMSVGARTDSGLVRGLGDNPNCTSLRGTVVSKSSSAGTVKSSSLPTSRTTLKTKAAASVAAHRGRDVGDDLVEAQRELRKRLLEMRSQKQNRKPSTQFFSIGSPQKTLNPVREEKSPSGKKEHSLDQSFDWPLADSPQEGD